MNEFKASDTWYHKAGEDNGECEAGLRNECNHIVGIALHYKRWSEENMKVSHSFMLKNKDNCNLVLEDKFKFCPECGSKLDNVE